MERKFYAQKAKCNFLLQGDKCSKLLHSLVKRNAKRRFISSLTRDDGSTTSVDEIHSEFLVYHSNLIGTREDVDDFDATVMDFSPKVSPFHTESHIRGIRSLKLRDPFRMPLVAYLLVILEINDGCQEKVNITFYSCQYQNPLISSVYSYNHPMVG
ncbi:hypothetical protein M9H77_17582 [Catharanthus roseus]|uniref:Uncharacterized protein n=1 Tax=Catharanthus roseus TaxID=4058 RepID=A0ACC0B507_CATRO|nr:hypothetical protein M9H77_17582 [Catharanthus roseus]